MLARNLGSALLAAFAVSLALISLAAAQHSPQLLLNVPPGQAPTGLAYFSVPQTDDDDDDGFELRFVVPTLNGPVYSVVDRQYTSNQTRLGAAEQWSTQPAAQYGNLFFDAENQLVMLTKTETVATSFGSVVVLYPSGEKLAEVTFNAVDDILKPRLISDVVTDNTGNLYVTDSLRGAIYKVDNQYRTSSVFFTNAAFEPTDAPVGLKGIEYFFGPNANSRRDEYLLVTVTSASATGAGGLFKIPIERPIGFTKTTIRGGTLASLDGLVLDRRSGRLYVVQQAANNVVQLYSEDDWITATIEKVYPVSCRSPSSIIYLPYPWEDVYVTCTDNRSQGPYYLERVKVENFVTNSANIDFSFSDSQSPATRVAIAVAATLLAVLVVMA